MRTTKVISLMTENPVFIAPDATLAEAAQKMREIDCGILPVGSAGHVKGVITDRDIVVRAVAENAAPAAEKLSAFMTKAVYACSEMDYLEDAAEKMRMHNVSRLLVKNKAGIVTGILSFGSILRRDADSQEVAGIVKHATGRAI